MGMIQRIYCSLSRCASELEAIFKLLASVTCYIYCLLYRVGGQRFFWFSLHLDYYPTTQFKTTPYTAPQNTGSTACVAVSRGNWITVANVGDSHCVVSRNGQAIELSTDHKPIQRDERRRIKRAGGRIWMDKLVLVGERVPLMGIRVIEGMLATSRVTSDFAFKQNENLPPAEQMAICDPHIHSMEITNGIEFLVMARHGIWECMTSQDVVDFVREEFESGETDLRVICQRLVDRCVASSDNGTAILVQFKDSTSNNDDNEGGDSRDQEDIASEASEDLPLPDDEMVARALEFLKGKRIGEGKESS